MSATLPSSATGARPFAGLPAMPWSKVSVRRPVEFEPVDETGIEIGDEELMACFVEYDIAETRAAIRSDRGEEADRAGRTVDAVDAAGGATLAPLPGHELGAGLTGLHPLGAAVAVAVGDDDLQTEGRGRAEVDVRGRRIIERDGKHLADTRAQAP